MKLQRILVKSLPGRVARQSKNGRFIPSDSFVPVLLTPYIDRLLNHFGDIVSQDPERPAPRSIKPKPGQPATEIPKPPAPVATDE